MTTFGNRIKQIRNSNNVSQPDLASFAGIEQSYLSKIENDKCLPSNDIFRALLSALNTDIEVFLEQLNEKEQRHVAQKIADIEQYVNATRVRSNVRSKWIIWMAFVSLVSGVVSFYTGWSAQLFSDESYTYESRGVVKAGEPIDLYGPEMRVLYPSRTEWENFQQALVQRRDPHQLMTETYLGSMHVVNVEGGKRLYYERGLKSTPNKNNALLQILGVLLLSIGIFSLLVETRLRSLR